MQTSLISQLVREWRSSPPPPLLSIQKLRVELVTTALEQMEQAAASNKIYNPMRDSLFLWACNWLDHHEDHSTPLNQDLQFACHLLLDPPLISHKHLAAADL